MEYRIINANPAGNITIIVKDFVEPTQRAQIANLLLENEKLHAEQVGFEVKPLHSGISRLEMMGGEFCGNATRSFGYYLAKKHGIERGSVLVEISGAKTPLEVSIDTLKGTAKTQMPCEFTLRELTLLGTEVFPMVEMEGISHIIVEGGDCEKNDTIRLLQAAREKVSADAIGILYWDGEQMVPVVYVESTGSLVYENSCGSGSVALSAYLIRDRKEGSFRRMMKQPGGVIETFIEKKQGKIVSCRMGGKIKIKEGTVSIDR